MIELLTRLRAPVAALALTLGLLAARPHASVVVPMSLADLTAAAERIVDATVVEVRHVEGPDGVERLVLLRVGTSWKGGGESSLYVRLAGGRIGRFETRVAGMPRVEPGDRLVWFLSAHPRGGYVVLGLHQGALRTMPAADGALMITAPPRTAGARGDVTRVPRRLEDVAADVRALLAAGAQP